MSPPLVVALDSRREGYVYTSNDATWESSPQGNLDVRTPSSASDVSLGVSFLFRRHMHLQGLPRLAVSATTLAP